MRQENAMTTSTNTQDFTAVLNLPVSPDDVAALLTSAEGVSRWWGPTEGDGGVGGTLTTAFGGYGVNAMRVVEVTPSRVVWESVVPEQGRPTVHMQEWLGTRLQFDLTPADGGTQLRFQHVGLNPQLDCWDECLAGWTHFMASIQAVAETGTGMPFGS
jgi:uncharacterized protein YndB with AHSA1/START domain